MLACPPCLQAHRQLILLAPQKLGVWPLATLASETEFLCSLCQWIGGGSIVGRDKDAASERSLGLKSNQITQGSWSRRERERERERESVATAREPALACTLLANMPASGSALSQRDPLQCAGPSRNPRWKCPSVGDYDHLHLASVEKQNSCGHSSGMPLLSSGGRGDPQLSAMIAFASTTSSSQTADNSTHSTAAHLVNENVGHSGLQNSIQSHQIQRRT